MKLKFPDCRKKSDGPILFSNFPKSLKQLKWIHLGRESVFLPKKVANLRKIPLGVSEKN